MCRKVKASLILTLACSPLGCIESLGTEQSAIGEVQRDCLLPTPPDVQALSAPVALEYARHSLWIWESLPLPKGGVVEAPYARVDSADDLCANGPQLHKSEAGEILSLIALSEAERADNAARDDGRRLALVPRGGLTDGDTGYLFYDHMLYGPGIFDQENLGTGLCVLKEGTETCERLGLPDATRLFAPSDWVLNRGGLVAEERGLIYGCQPVAALQAVCTVSGAPVDSLREPGAYRVHSDFEGWQPQLERGSSLVDELGPMTVSHYQSGYLMTALDIFEARVYLRYADTPLGPFGRRVAAFDILPTQNGFPGGGREHAGLRRDPHTLHLTYVTDQPGASGLHLVTFRVLGRFWE